MKKLALAALGLVALMSSSASADDKTATVVHQVKDQIIVGRPAKPLAATEVSKLPVTTTLSELRQPLASRVEQPVAGAPF